MQIAIKLFSCNNIKLKCSRIQGQLCVTYSRECNWYHLIPFYQSILLLIQGIILKGIFWQSKAHAKTLFLSRNVPLNQPYPKQNFSKLQTSYFWPSLSRFFSRFSWIEGNFVFQAGLVHFLLRPVSLFSSGRLIRWFPKRANRRSPRYHLQSKNLSKFPLSLSFFFISYTFTSFVLPIFTLFHFSISFEIFQSDRKDQTWNFGR